MYIIISQRIDAAGVCVNMYIILYNPPLQFIVVVVRKIRLKRVDKQKKTFPAYKNR